MTGHARLGTVSAGGSRSLPALLYGASWIDTLTLENPITVSGTNGSFELTDGSTITMTNNAYLDLLDLAWNQPAAQDQWTSGTITGNAGTALYVYGSDLTIQGIQGSSGPWSLGTSMGIGQSVATGNNGIVTLQAMSSNLMLTGTNNLIDVGSGTKGGGVLNLNQNITAQGQQNTVGGIGFGPAHQATAVAVQVENGGRLYRGGVPTQGVTDQVSIAGPVYNLGGTVEAGTLLNITGKDANGYSYWQKTGGAAVLQVDGGGTRNNGGNINAAGTYQIDTGTVKLTASSGATYDELDGAGLNFGNANATTLTIVDSRPTFTGGTVTIQGPVTLGQNTTIKMNYTGANNTPDLLDVHNGTLTLNGFLSLTSQDLKKPTQPLNFLDDSGNTPSIAGAFTSISDNVGTKDTGKVVPDNEFLDYYQVTIQ